jgi:hypothetical protein
MSTVPHYTVAVLFLGVGLHFAHRPQEKTEPKTAAAKEQITKLISELGDVNFKIRESALQRLFDIGVPALDALENACQADDFEIRARAQLLIKKIEYSSLPVAVVNGMRFRLIVDRHWVIPEKGGRASTGIIVECTNLAEKKTLRFWPMGSTSFLMIDSRGLRTFPLMELQSVGPLRIPLLKQNDCYRFEIDATLVWRRDELTLIFHDLRGRQSEGVTVEKHFKLAINYENHSHQIGEFNDNLWTGDLQTSYVPISLK